MSKIIQNKHMVSPRSLIKLGIVYDYCYHHFWIRFKCLEWRGFIIKDIRIYPLLFSERNGFKRTYFPRMWWCLLLLSKPADPRF